MRKGITLIETILMVTLLAAASAAGLILFDGQWVARRGAVQATNDVAEALTTARNTSMRSQANVSVRRMTNRGRQALLIVEDAGPYRDGKQWTIDLGTEIRLTGRPATIQFRPDGTADRGLQWNVNQDSVTGQVAVAPVSGQIVKKLP